MASKVTLRSSLQVGTFTCLIIVLLLNSYYLLNAKATHESSFIRHYLYYINQPKINSHIQLQCPLSYVQRGDEIIFHQQNRTALEWDVLYTVRIDEQTRLADLQLPYLSDRVDYSCELRRSVNSKQHTVSITKFIVNKNSGFEQFTYDPTETIQFSGEIGQPLTVTCPHVLKTAQIAWFFLSGFQLENQTGEKLRFKQLQLDDFGVYYCTDQLHTTKSSKLKVQKVEVSTRGYSLISQPGVPKYIDGWPYLWCPPKAHSLSSIIWEYPKGVILVGEHNEWLRLDQNNEQTQSQLALCQYLQFQQDKNVNSKRLYNRIRRSITLLPQVSFLRRTEPNDITIDLQCDFDGGPNQTEQVKYSWRIEDDGHIEEGQNLRTQLYLKSMLTGDEKKKNTLVTCEVESVESGMLLGSTTVDTEPIAITSGGTLALTETVSKIYSFRLGESIELHCEVDKEYAESGKDLIWRFNGGSLPAGTENMDKLRTSILIIKSLNFAHEGLYSCHQNGKILKGHLIQRPIPLSLGIEPISVTHWANAGEIAEFRCRLDGREEGNQLTDWYFIPEGSDLEIPVHSDVQIDRPYATPYTSFITIKNVQKYHEGQYVCRALSLRSAAQLIVRTRNLSVTPEELQARPGSTVQFLCELSAVSGVSGGKLFWIRTDRQGLRPGKEEVIGSSGGRALLIVRNIDRNDHNVTYMCSDGYNHVNATLFVHEVCDPGFKLCGTGICLKESQFCDGIKDCDDGSDEVLSKCLECGPNEFVCGIHNDVKPLKNCYLQFWHCDGEDDCGNGYDEANCKPASETTKCDGTHFVCPKDKKLIARAFMCDGVPDCEPNGDDEYECSHPSIIEPTREAQLIGRNGGNLTLTCIAYGRPPPAVNWRFNWGKMREGTKYTINNTVVDCNLVISHLTLIDMDPHSSGLYTCEAVNRGRILAPDISVTVTKGGICQIPQFNDDAWFEDMCLNCYCSNVTNICTSAKGYRKSPKNKVFDLTPSRAIVRSYTNIGFEEHQNIIESEENLMRVTQFDDDNSFIESDFDLAGSWVSSYGYDMILNLRLFGETLGYSHGPYITLRSVDRTVYWCSPADRILLYSTPMGYSNNLRIRLTERDRWYLNRNCTEPVFDSIGRAGFLQILSQITSIGIRTKMYQKQVGMEIYKLELEHAVKSDIPGQWVGEIEQCACPPGYTGLSCESCSRGYHRAPDDPQVCRPYCACDECDEKGNCLSCPGNRAGPRCEQCKSGYYRPLNSSLVTDCKPCTQCAENLPYAVKTCLADPLMTNNQLCKCEVDESWKLLDPDCDLCELAKMKGVDQPENAQCESRPEPPKCHPKGAKSISPSLDCICKPGYTGETCTECVDGYFKHGDQCLECYCAGKTKVCQLSNEYYFWNLTEYEPSEYTLDVWLGQRTLFNNLERSDKTPEGYTRLERSNMEYVVKHPLSKKGVIHFGINLLPIRSGITSDQADLPLYRQIYGGQMSFRLDTIRQDPNTLSQSEASVIIEIESPRYGRVWTLAAYDPQNQRYEVKFDENWWAGGWKKGIPGLDSTSVSLKRLEREALLRVLGTASNLVIVTSSGNSETLHGMRLFGLSVQLALPADTEEKKQLAMQRTLPVAPVEVCNCPDPINAEYRKLSTSCEGCPNPKQKTVIRLEPDGEDFTCGGCVGAECGECAEGEFIYDIYTGERYETCQKGLLIDTKQRHIIVDEGSPINLICRATSYRGGLVEHTWIPPKNEGASQSQIVRRSLDNTANQTVHRSEVVLSIENAQLTDSGTYKCIASGVGSILEEKFHVTVHTADEPVEKIGVPKIYSYEIVPDANDPNQIIVTGVVANGTLLNHYNILWQTLNGSEILPIKVVTDPNTGKFSAYLPIPHEPVKNGNISLVGYFTGSNPIFNPIWYRMPDPSIDTTNLASVTAADIIDPPKEVIIPFMQPHHVQVRTKPGRSGITVNWKRISDVPKLFDDKKEQEKGDKKEEQVKDLPDGVSQDSNSLNIWAAAEQHEGVYEGIVYRESDGKELKRINVTISVNPLHPGDQTELDPGTSGEPSELPGEEKLPPVWDFLISGFTPEAQYCEEPKWTLVDYRLNQTTDITHKVIRVSKANFRVDYPLSSGMYIRFECQPVPLSTLSGEIKFNISSPDPRILLKPIYDDANSTFPTRLICMDLNPDRDSDLEITADTMDKERIRDALTPTESKAVSSSPQVPIRQIELDWRRIANFDPFNDAGKFVCTANNTATTGSKEIKLPRFISPLELAPADFSRIYIYSPDTYVSPVVNGTSKVTIPEGGQLRVYCVYDSRPVDNFHGWRTDSTAVQSGMTFDKREYSALIQTTKADVSLDKQIIECVVGEQKKTVEITVIPEGEQKLQAKVISNAFLDETLIGTTGSDLNLTCDIQKKNQASINRIDWYLQYANGIRIDVKRANLAETIQFGDNGEWIHFDNLLKKSFGSNIFCVIRLKDVPRDKPTMISSPLVKFLIRQPKLIAEIEGESRPGVVVGTETETIHIKCVAKDALRNKTVDDVQYSWDTKITSVQEEGEGNVFELARPKPTERDYPMQGVTTQNGYLVLAGLRQRPNWIARFRCRAEDKASDTIAHSHWTKLEVKPGDTLRQIPKLRLVPHIDPKISLYPYKIDCVDENELYPSQVTWVRQEESLDPHNLEEKPNLATLKFMHKETKQFNPQIHAGLYTCRASNSYASTMKKVYLPLEVMPEEKTPMDARTVRITSDVNEIFEDDGDRYVRVMQNQPFELVCLFYGHPPPAGGLTWSIDRVNGTSDSLSQHWIAMQGLIVKSGRQYWTQIGVPKFDALGKHTGVYQCKAVTEDGKTITRNQVRVELHKVYVRINELSDSGLIEGTQGQDGTITCNAYDGYLQFILPGVTYSWEVERLNGKRVHPNLIASEVTIEGNEMTYKNLDRAANGLRVRCVAINGTARYVSKDFGFRVYGGVSKPSEHAEIEPGGTRWVAADGKDRIILKIEGVNEKTAHVSIMEGDTVRLNCTAYDSVTDRPITDGQLQFGWHLLSSHGQPVSYGQIADGLVQTYASDEMNSGIFIADGVRHKVEQPSAQIQCLATSLKDMVTYYTAPVDIYVHSKDMPIDLIKEMEDRTKRNRIRVHVEGLDDRGMLSASEDTVKTLTCLATDEASKETVKLDLVYAWEFSELDGTPVDTNALIKPQGSGIHFKDNQLTLRGLKQTSSVRGRCRVTSLLQPDDVFYSPFFRFDVVDEAGKGFRNYVPPDEPEFRDDVLVMVNGLDETGHVSANVNDTIELTCAAQDQVTGTLITGDTENRSLSYGWEFLRINGLPAYSSDLASEIEVDSQAGTLKLIRLYGQPDEEHISNRVQARCVVQVYNKSKEPTVDAKPKSVRYTSSYFMFNVPKDVTPIPEFIDDTHQRYNLTVKGLNKDGILPLKHGKPVELDCIITDTQTDTLMNNLVSTQTIGWQFPVLPSGHQVNPADVARSLKTDGSKLTLEDVRDNVVDGLRGRCWFYDGFSYYYSPYFPVLVPRSTTDGRVRVEVQELYTGDKRQYLCAAYDGFTGARLTDVSYDWKLTASTGENILPSYYFSLIEKDGNQLTLQHLRTNVQLPVHLRDKIPIEGRCLVLSYQHAGDVNTSSRINVYTSQPFILINPSSADPEELIKRPSPFEHEKRLFISIDGVTKGLVRVPINGTVTLTCNALDTKTMKHVEGLTYMWEMQLRDGSPIDTAALVTNAVLVEGSGGNRLSLIGMRSISSGLRGRCVVTNETKLDPDSDDTGLLKPGAMLSSTFFDFDLIKHDDVLVGITEPEFTGPKDYDVVTDAKTYKVVVSGLDDKGNLKVTEGSNVTLEAMLQDIDTGEVITIGSDSDITHFGLETRYDNGHSAPLNSLADSVRVHSQNGRVDFYGLRNQSEPPVQLRFVIERRVPDPDSRNGKTITVRYASHYIDVVTVAEGEDKEEQPEEVEPMPIFPIIDGLNQCGRLPIKIGTNVTLICRPNDTRILTENLVYGWEIRQAFGQNLPHVNLLAKSSKQEQNRLVLIGMLDPKLPLIGRCIIVRTSGKCEQYNSPYFEIGSHGEECEPTKPVLVPEEPWIEPIPRRIPHVIIRIEGLDDNGQIFAKPGDNITLKCSALNSTTKEILKDATIGWSFISDTDEALHAGQLASRVETTTEKELQLISLLENYQARGRCIVTLDKQVTISSPYFGFHVPGPSGKPIPSVNPSYSDKRVRVEVSGLSKRGQVSVTRVGDDATLRCQAIIVDTSAPLLPVHGVRYGWEWRYMDEDPVSSSTVAVSLEANGERLGLKGVQAPAGTRGRNVKGRCVVHVPARNVDPESPDDIILVYGSDYFTIDVVKKPTALDPDELPKTGKESDEIEVVVNGLNEKGYLVGNEKESVGVNCEVQNKTTKERLSVDGIRAEYNVLYGWEFADASGRSIDSSLFADNVAMDAFGNLRLRGLTAPRRGHLPFKIRCVTVITKRPESPDKRSGPPVKYNSDYFGLDIKRPDGSSTIDGKLPDVLGKLVKVHIEGLKADGTLTAEPGENVNLNCVAQDTETFTPLADAKYGWEFRRSSGSLINLGLLTDQIIQEGSNLEIKSIKDPKDSKLSIQGRCIVYKGDQIYKSDYFAIKVAVLPRDYDVEGDGKVLVTVENVPIINWTILAEPNKQLDLDCVAIDAKTGHILTDLSYGWDFVYTSPNGPMVHGSLGALVEHMTETSDGMLIVKTSAKATAEGIGKLKCRVFVNSTHYSSPYYRFMVKAESDDTILPDPAIYPKYRVRVAGLSEDGMVDSEPGSTISLECLAVDAKSGLVTEGLDYRWKIQELSGSSAIASDIVTDELVASGRRLNLNGLQAMNKMFKGRCEVSEPGSGTWDYSPYFTVFSPSMLKSDEEPDDGLIKPFGPKRADATDRRIIVKVDGLNEEGHFEGTAGTNRTLHCVAEKTSENLEIISYDWILMDGHGNVVPLDQIAETLTVSIKTGELKMSNLQITKLSNSGNLKGQCLVLAKDISEVQKSDGSITIVSEMVKFSSTVFGISITADGSQTEKIGGYDVQGSLAKVLVKGLDPDGVLLAEVGDIVTLKCYVLDVQTETEIPNSIYSWELQHRSGIPVSTSLIARNVSHSGNNITFTLLAPTEDASITEQIFGRCVVIATTTNHLYYSDRFRVDVRRPSQTNKQLKPVSKVSLQVRGVTEDGLLEAKEGDTAVLECQAFNATTKDPLTDDNYITQFRFDTIASDKDATYGGYLADQVIEEQLPKGGGVRLTLIGLKADHWHRGYCVAILDPTKIYEGKTDPQEIHYSNYFWSAITPAGAVPKAREEVKNTTIINGITYDPNILVKVHGFDENDQKRAKIGSDISLHCYTIATETGQPIEYMDYAWVFSTMNDNPISSDQLGKRITTAPHKSQNGQILLIENYQGSDDWVKIRCLSTGTSVIADETMRGHTYSSPVYTLLPLSTQKTEIEEKTRYDPSQLKVEIDGLNTDGTLSGKQGDNVTLTCQVEDLATGEINEGPFTYGWVLGTGPDNRPISLNDLATNVKMENEKLTLEGLKQTTAKSGGLRGHCQIRLTESDLLGPEKYGGQAVVLKSDVFVIHVSPQLFEDTTKGSEDEQTHFINWIPGKDPKDAVIVKVTKLQPDGSVLVEPGNNLTLNCIALDGVSLRRITQKDNLTPLFSWELIPTIGQPPIHYSAMANGPISVTQPSKLPTVPDEEGLSQLRLEKIYFESWSSAGIHGRCTVQLGKQVFHSPYFQIRMDHPNDKETYSPVPATYWSDDGSVEVVVIGLEDDGNKRITEGSDVNLQCKVQDARTKQALPDEHITLGWTVFDPVKHKYQTPWITNGRIAGSKLELKGLEIPDGSGSQWKAWGWCVADIRSGISGPMKHYRSAPFELILSHKDKIEEETKMAVKPTAVFVRVDGLSKDGQLSTTEGDDTQLTCRAIDTTTGHEYTAEKITYGWDWRYLDGEPADISELSDAFMSDGNQLTIDNIKYSVPIKGRCLVTIRPPNQTLEKDTSLEYRDQYASDFFFLNVNPQSKDISTRPMDCRPIDTTDDAVLVEVNPLDKSRSISLIDSQDLEIDIMAKLSATGSELDEFTTPKLLRYSYQLLYTTGDLAHSNELGETVTFNIQAGKLKIRKAHFTTKPLKIRFAALVMQESDNEDKLSKKLCQPRRYWTEFFTIQVLPKEGNEKPSWADRVLPLYDITGNSMIVKVSGLDSEGNVAGNEGEDVELTCQVFDKFEMDAELPPTSYAWQFVDDAGRPANPGQIAKEIEITNGNTLKLINYKKSAQKSNIRGRCVIQVTVPVPVDAEPHEDLPPLQEYMSSYFYFGLKHPIDTLSTPESSQTDKQDEATTTSTYTKPETAVQPFYLKIGSTVNAIYPTGDTEHAILARNQRPFELNCQAVFADGSPSPEDHQPRLFWYYRQPEIPGDVPIPSELYQVSPPRMETLDIHEQVNNKIAITSNAFTFRDDVAEFQCQAFVDSDQPVAKQIVFIHKIKEMFDLRIFDEDSRSRVYAFTNTDKVLTCFVDDLSTGERIEPSGYRWEITSVDGTTSGIKESSVKQPASSIEGWTSNQLRLTGLRLPSSALIDEASYEFRCVAIHNDTFDTISRPFIMNIRRKPAIKSIRIDRIKPEEAVLDLTGTPKDSYDATQDYQLGCIAEVTSGEAVAIWQKCEDHECNITKDMMPVGDKLFLFANSTRYTDEGRFRCQVSLQLKEYNFKLVQSRDIILTRKAAPAIYSSESITYTTNDEMSLQCTDDSSSPEAKVEWSFEPSGEVPSERKNPLLLGKKYAYDRIYIFAIARGQLRMEHSGKYTCTATNKYGSSSSSISVKVTEESNRRQLRFARHRSL